MNFIWRRDLTKTKALVHNFDVKRRLKLLIRRWVNFRFIELNNFGLQVLDEHILLRCFLWHDSGLLESNLSVVLLANSPTINFFGFNVPRRGADHSQSLNLERLVKPVDFPWPYLRNLMRVLIWGVMAVVLIVDWGLLIVIHGLNGHQGRMRWSWRLVQNIHVAFRYQLQRSVVDIWFIPLCVLIVVVLCLLSWMTQLRMNSFHNQRISFKLFISFWDGLSW